MPQAPTDITDDWLLQHQMRLEAAQQKSSDTFADLCPQLAELGVNIVRIAYDGFADEGAVERVTASDDDGEIELAAELKEQLTEAAYDFLPGGWENNDGAFGELVLDVPASQITREHNWRFMDSEYTEETFELDEEEEHESDN